MSTKEGTLTFDISSFWQAGTGRGESYAIDSTAHRNHHELPELPGRSVKGLVRDAVVHAEELGVLPPLKVSSTALKDQPISWSTYLFGPRGEDGADTWKGLLRFSSARLPEQQAHVLVSNPKLRSALFEVHHSTSVSTASGTAKHNSLRSMEVAIPLRLYAHVSTVAGVEHLQDEHDWCEVLERCLPLLRGLGAKRSRGYGRCAVSLEREKPDNDKSEKGS